MRQRVGEWLQTKYAICNTQHPSPLTLSRALLPWLSLAVLACIAGAPLLAEQGPSGFDTSFHLWRAVEAERLLRAGVLWPQWSPAMAWGYGYPLFVFQGALSAQMAALLHLVGFSWPVALYGAYFLGLVGSAWSLYLLARAWWGEVGGWGSAALFLFIPFHLYVVHYRASLSETLAWVFPPLVLWGMLRWAEGRRRGLLVGALALAALPMAHPVSLYLFLPLLGAAALAEIARAEAPERKRAALRVCGLLALGLTLGAFAWLPGLSERSAVQLGRATSAWVFDYRANFLPAAQLLPWPRNADPLLLNDWPARGVGALFLLMGGVGMVAAWSLYPKVRARLLALGLVGGGALFLSVGLSEPVWERIALLGAFQFPWRFLAPASLVLALFSGAAIEALARQTRQGWGGLLAVALVCVAHWGWLYPPRGGLPGPANPAGMLAWERATDTIGTTASGELLPVWVTALPSWDNPLAGAYARGEEPARLDPASLPPQARVVAAEYRPLRARLVVVTPIPFQARWLAFYYPGWQVRVDGAPVAVAPEAGAGVITFAIPAGEHEVEIYFGQTPLRRAVNVLSLGALLALLVIALRQPVNGGAFPEQISSFPLSAFILSLLLFALFWFAEPLGLPFRRARLQPDGTLSGVAAPLRVNFGGRALLLGADLPAPMNQTDATLELALYWQALDPGEGDWHDGIALVAPDGDQIPLELRALRWGRMPPPVQMWPREQYAVRAYHLDLPPGMPPGDYGLALSLFDRETLEPASVLGADGNPLGPTLPLGVVQLTRPAAPPSLAALDVPEDTTPLTCGALALWSLTADRVEAAPGEIVGLRLVWEALETPSEVLSATLTLHAVPGVTTSVGGPMDLSEAALQTWELPPVASWWPTNQWRAGERWVGRPVVRLPGGLESSDYRLEVSLPGCATLGRVHLRVRAPERTWDVPPDLQPLDAVFDGQVRLVGYAAEPEAEAVRVTLAWQAMAEMMESYRVFVHLVDETARLAAQSDGEPAAWSRPTTGWAVGEVVTETRVLSAPGPGRYTLRVGLYLPDGPRLTLPDGQDAFELTVEIP